MNGSDIQVVPLFAAGVEFLVVLLIMAASALFNWWQKRKQGEQDEWSGLDQPTPPNAPTSAPRQTTNWEEELRRMLEGEQPAAPPAAPPVIREQRPTPRTATSRPMPSPTPPPVQPVKTYRGDCEHCNGHLEFPSNLTGSDIRCPHCHRQTRLFPLTEIIAEPRPQRPDLSPVPRRTAVQAPTHAEHALAARFAEVAPRGSSHAAVVQRRETSYEVQKVVSLFQHPRTARHAVIASIILNPPKALEP
ncbi:MAG: hypothetical protein H0X66_21140 [Verrucomicrobia bacterium]|nr:hypothetical protein [Verrucomicrobiota bacterium]